MILIRDKENDSILFRVNAPTLEAADLCKRRLRYANLNGAVLRFSDMHRADLWGTDLRGADLRLANLTMANLGNADFLGANMDGVELDGARYNERTRWPEGFRPELHNLIVEELPEAARAGKGPRLPAYAREAA